MACSRAPEPRTSILTGSGYPANAVGRTRAPSGVTETAAGRQTVGMARTRIDDGLGRTAVRSYLADEAGASRDTRALAVRYTLQLLAEQAEGNTVEVRVPPFGATQCIAGPRHTRGTPPNVVETDVATWLGLATGTLAWTDGIASGRIHASGQRADLSAELPVLPMPAGE
jgi:hypothetical protein